MCPLSHIAARLSALAVAVLFLPAEAADALYSGGALPEDAELQERGAVIGEIYVLAQDVFDENDPQENGHLYRLANRLHINTHETAIRAQLLFASGDPYSRRVLEETERNLRHSPYLIAPEVRPLRYRDNKVDILVSTHDVWSLDPGVSFGRSGGANSSSIGLEERNFLGWGKHVSLQRASNVERTSVLLGYRDENLLGSRWRLGADYADNSDGRVQAFFLERPFFALETRWSALLNAESGERIDSRYQLGHRYDDYQVAHRDWQIGGGWSTGLQNGWVRRWTSGFRYVADDFEALNTTRAAIPEDRILAYPFVSLEWLQDDFAEALNRNQIGRIEDLQFGARARVELGWSSSAFGADRNALIYSLEGHRGLRLSGERSLFFDSGLSGRLEGGTPRDALLHASTRFYWPWRSNRVFFAAVDADYGHALDADHFLELGGGEDRDVRGYPLRYQSGTSRALLTLEQRFFTHWYPLRLFRVGGAVFFDAGQVWGPGAVGQTSQGLLMDAGFGLRLGSMRSAHGNVIHLDVAAPLNGASSTRDIQFLIRTKASF